MSLSTLIRGLALLRYPEIVRDLGTRRFHLLSVAEINALANRCKVDPDIVLVGYRRELIDIQDDVTIAKGSVLAFGDTNHGFGTVKIGRGSWIGQYNNLRAGGGDISIGSRCLISQFCTIVASNHSTARDMPIQNQPPRQDRAGVTIGDDVWLGAGTTITAGVQVSNGAVCAAGSVITRDIPKYEIWGGIPAKKIGER